MGHPGTQYLSPILSLSHVHICTSIVQNTVHAAPLVLRTNLHPISLTTRSKPIPALRYLLFTARIPLSFLTANLCHYHRTYVIFQWDSASLCTPSNCPFHVSLHISDILHGPDSWISFLTPASCISHFSRSPPHSTFCDFLVTSASFYPPRSHLALFCLNALSLKFVFVYARLYKVQ